MVLCCGGVVIVGGELLDREHMARCRLVCSLVSPAHFKLAILTSLAETSLGRGQYLAANEFRNRKNTL